MPMSFPSPTERQTYLDIATEAALSTTNAQINHLIDPVTP
ncbi:hypothetical protein NIES970_08330 [[Synechococcus] sp. NIES-970]|nr:hypothetical protein NIES970_08330 [[Synechococcus] sp. NIES-970]